MRLYLCHTFIVRVCFEPQAYLQILATALSEADVSQQILYWHSDTDSEVDLVVTINGAFGTCRKT